MLLYRYEIDHEDFDTYYQYLGAGGLETESQRLKRLSIIAVLILASLAVSFFLEEPNMALALSLILIFFFVVTYLMPVGPDVKHAIRHALKPTSIVLHVDDSGIEERDGGVTSTATWESIVRFAIRDNLLIAILETGQGLIVVKDKLTDDSSPIESLLDLLRTKQIPEDKDTQS
ncbi:MAG: YcxB family protein [Pseudomonadota bacterium]